MRRRNKQRRIDFSGCRREVRGRSWWKRLLLEGIRLERPDGPAQRVLGPILSRRRYSSPPAVYRLVDNICGDPGDASPKRKRKLRKRAGAKQARPSRREASLADLPRGIASLHGVVIAFDKEDRR